MGLLDGRVALITGAASGIGLAIVETFVREGAAVAAVDIDHERLRKSVTQFARGDATVVPIETDVGNPEQVARAGELAVTEFGVVDILVNNAGIMRVHPVLDFPLEEWSAVFRVNLEGALLFSQVVARHLIAKERRGSIVNISSAAARKADPGHAAYSASKAALLQLTRSLALELGPHGIRANAVLPGATETPMLDTVSAEVPGIREDLISRTVLQKLGTPQDQANAALFLASDLSAHVTGEYLVVSGGEFMNA